MPLWGRKRKGYPGKEKTVHESDSADAEKPKQQQQQQQQGKALNSQRAVNNAGAQANKDSVFAAGRFHDLGLAPALSDHIHAKLSFSAPTLIQKSAIPIVLSGRDVLVNADTGTGKTMVYLAPIVNALQSYDPRITRNDGTMALVLVPTRELCLQVCAVAEQVVHRFHWLVPGCVMGGENRSKEKARLRKGITILVATPGRLLDHLKNTACFRHDRLRWIVFDEADRLLDLGFEKDIESILEVLGSRDDNNRTRQHVLLSATLNEHVEQLAALSLHDPATVGLEEAMPAEIVSQRESGNGSSRTQSEILKHERNLGDAGPSDGYTEYRIPSQLVQGFLKVPCSLRLVALLGLLQQKSLGNRSCKLVVFFSTCDAVDFHYTIANEFRWSPTPWKDGVEEDERKLLGCDVFRLHGSMAQKDRTEAYNQFGMASSAILLCTDVAARGLDFQSVSGIVQYEPPGDAAEYVHRVGRTARLGQKGEAILFLQPSEGEYMQELKKHGVSLQEHSLPKLLDGLQARRGKRDDSFSAVEMHPLAGLMQKALDAFVAAKPDARLLAVDAFRSFVRAYAAHRGELKSIFQVRKLHLGHVAKSFGLRDAPTLFGKSVNKQNLKKEKDRNVKKRIRKKRRFTPGAMED